MTTMSSEDTRELKSLKLSSGEAKVVTFFTRSEVRAIKKARWKGTEISVDDSEKIVAQKLDPGSEDYQDDELVFQGTKSIDGKPVTREIIDDLKIKDFDICLKYLKKLFLGNEKK